MKTAVIGDIHGNLPGLELVLEDIRSRNIERIICLGDLVEGGGDSENIIALMQAREILTVQGNHDLINDLHLDKNTRKWLVDLPEEFVEGEHLFTHVSPRERKQSIKNKIEAWNVFRDREFTLCFIGHTHMPLLFGDRNEEFGEARDYEMDEGVFVLDSSDRYIVSFGAIGYPRAGGDFIRYGIYDQIGRSVQFVRLDGPLLDL